MYTYNDKFSPEENIAHALYAIANELNNIGLRDAIIPGEYTPGALELVAKELRDGFQSLGHQLADLTLPD